MTSPTILPVPGGPALAWVGEHLAGLWVGPLAASGRFRGGGSAAERALDGFDVGGYGRRRNEVWPLERRGASALSPYIRHGVLSLPRVWDAVAGGPADDVRRFRDELLWQEYARHLYARLGHRLGSPLRARRPVRPAAEPWPGDMSCVDLAVKELENDGWLVNQTRMWLASQWSVRTGAAWEEGEDRFFAHLLDGSRAANRLGWQWAVGTATGRPYGFSRWQVSKRAPGLCQRCPLRRDCPIEHWPGSDDPERIDADPLLRADPDVGPTAGPDGPELSDGRRPEAVWLTAESLGDDDPALAAHLDLPAVFTFDRRLLERLGLSAKRLIFLAETLADLAERRHLEIHLGDPVQVLAGRAVATTFAPVPGWRRRRVDVDVVALHPWRWLRRPGAGSLTSFSAWQRSARPRPT